MRNSPVIYKAIDICIRDLDISYRRRFIAVEGEENSMSNLLAVTERTAGNMLKEVLSVRIYIQWLIYQSERKMIVDIFRMRILADLILLQYRL